MKKVAPLVALWLPLGSQKDCKSLWPHRLAARTLASHAGNLGTKTDNSGEISSIKIIAWLVPSFLRMKKGCLRVALFLLETPESRARND
mgnify:CR=1 FL=1